jgi:hypothetical protein
MQVAENWLALVNGDSKKSGSVPTRISYASVAKGLPNRCQVPNRCQAPHASSRKLASISKR